MLAFRIVIAVSLIVAACRFVYPDDGTDERADEPQAVAFCRGQFVIVAFRDAP